MTLPPWLRNLGASTDVALAMGVAMLIVVLVRRRKKKKTSAPAGPTAQPQLSTEELERAASSALVDTDIEPVSVDAGLHAVSRYFATYNLVNAPVVDSDHRLIGAITVDDVLDHALPADWRGNQLDAPIEEATGIGQIPPVRLDEAVSSGQG